MSEYVISKEQLYIPLIPVGVEFHKKEDVELNVYQEFLLEAIEGGASVEQLTEATQLTSHVIETELLQMEAQKLLIRENGGICLSELSKKLRMIDRCVKSLNREKKHMCVNLVTGEFEAHDADMQAALPPGAIALQGKIRPQDVIDIDILESIDFFAEYMDTFETMETEQIQSVLEAVYAEFNELSGKIVYKQETVTELPCLIGEGTSNTTADLYAQGSCSVVEMEVVSNTVAKYYDFLAPARTLNEKAPELLSEWGQRLVNEADMCQKYNRERITYLYDHVSGLFREQSYQGSVKQNRVQLQLPARYEMNDTVKNQLIMAAKKKWQLDSNFYMRIKSIQKKTYLTGFSSDEL